MTDIELNRALGALGIDELSYRALPLLPLVRVAWADGQVQPGERDLILDLAENTWQLGEEGQRVLRNWLTHPPSAAYLHQGQQALIALAARQHPDMALGTSVLGDVRRLAIDVAKSAGGLFGIGAVSKTENEVIAGIAKELRIPEGATWETLPGPQASGTDGDPPRRRVTITTNTVTLDVSPQGGVLKTELDFSFRLPVTREGVTIGASDDADVQIEQDEDVAPLHCRLIEESRKFYVRDLESATGTWVDGERIVDRRLLGGEKLRIGSSPFEFKLLRKIPGSLLEDADVIR